MLFARFRVPNVEKLMKRRDLYGLIKALRHPSSIETRIAAVYALKKDERAVLPLTSAALGDPHESVRLAALEVLRGLTWPLHRHLETGQDPPKIVSVLRVVQRLEDQSAVPLVMKRLAGQDEQIRKAAADALSAIGDSRNLTQLESLYKREESALVKEAIETCLSALRQRIYRTPSSSSSGSSS